MKESINNMSLLKGKHYGDVDSFQTSKRQEKHKLSLENENSRTREGVFLENNFVA